MMSTRRTSASFRSEEPAQGLDSRPELASWHRSLAVVIGDYSQLGSRPWNELRQMQIFPGVRLDAEPIVVPEEWLPPAKSRRFSHRAVYVSRKLWEGVSLPKAEGSPMEEAVRRTLLALWLPHQTKTGVRRYKPNVWLEVAHLTIRVARWVLCHRPSGTGTIWSHLTVADWLTIRTEVVSNDHKRQFLSMLVRLWIDYGERGVLPDYPRIFQKEKRPESYREPSRQGAKPVRSKKTAEKNFQPFGDAFVTELLWRAIWLNENLSPQLIECWKQLQEINKRSEAEGKTAKHPNVIEQKRRQIASFDWRDASGRPIVQLPFSIVHTKGTKTYRTDLWPPENARTINILMSVVQALNFCLLAFCTGARISELGGANLDSLVVEGDHIRYRARTYKLVARLGGMERDWPLHPIAGRALEIQYALRAAAGAGSGSPCWVTLRSNNQEPIGSPLFDLNEPVFHAVQHLGLEHLLQGIRPHAHRWRHTMARLVALSVMGAPQVLLDLFGHRHLEMTMRYMLSHPEIAQEVSSVAKAMTFALAEQAIAETLGDRTSGLGAEKLQNGLTQLKMRQGEREFDTTTLKETAEILTFGGRSWHMVREGVLCTKTVHQSGPCTKSRGEPDPGSCRTDCRHRLELERTRAQCSSAIQGLLRELSEAKNESAVMLVENLSGQLIAQLKRWDDVRAHWLNQSALAREVWDRTKS